MEASQPGFGAIVRNWRQRRRMSQLDLACEAEISTRHLSFLETGRSAPSREMVLRLAEHLEAPLRDRNLMLLAAGYAPGFAERSLGDPELGRTRSVLETLLRAHEPFPALVVDRQWNLVAANRSVAALTAGASEELLQTPVNVLRLSLHPDGMAPRIENLSQWRTYLLNRLGRQVDDCGDLKLSSLLAELCAYPAPESKSKDQSLGDQIAVALRLRTDHGVLAFWSTTMTFDAATDVTVSELMMETFLPADDTTNEVLMRLAASR